MRERCQRRGLRICAGSSQQISSSSTGKAHHQRTHPGCTQKTVRIMTEKHQLKPETTPKLECLGGRAAGAVPQHSVPRRRPPPPGSHAVKQSCHRQVVGRVWFVWFRVALHAGATRHGHTTDALQRGATASVLLARPGLISPGQPNLQRGTRSTGPEACRGRGYVARHMHGQATQASHPIHWEREGGARRVVHVQFARD